MYLKSVQLINIWEWVVPNKNWRNNAKLKLCLVTVFVFYFQKLVFRNIKKKTIFFLYFLNQKHVWLVEIKNIVFWRKK